MIIPTTTTIIIIMIRDWRTWKLANEWRPSKQKHY